VLKLRAREHLLSSGAGVKDQTEETRSEVKTVILRAPKSPKYPGWGVYRAWCLILALHKVISVRGRAHGNRVSDSFSYVVFSLIFHLDTSTTYFHHYIRGHLYLYALFSLGETEA